MSNLKRFEDEERESRYGRVYAVSGPGRFPSSNGVISSSSSLITMYILFVFPLIPMISRHCRMHVWLGYVRIGTCRLLRVGR